MNLINVLKQKKVKSPPIWIMRQAGRYLPEFRKLKKKSKGFMNMIYNPKIASDITMQPIKRFEFDAAIIFSDILIIPDSLGQELTYEEGKGPRLKEMTLDQMVSSFSIVITWISSYKKDNNQLWISESQLCPDKEIFCKINVGLGWNFWLFFLGLYMLLFYIYEYSKYVRR